MVSPLPACIGLNRRLVVVPLYCFLTSLLSRNPLSQPPPCQPRLQNSMSATIDNGCKGTYACVRPRRYTYGIYWNTVANVDASDSRCRCIGKIIARDLRLVASRLSRMTVTRPRVTCRRYSIPLFRRRPPGLNKSYKRNGKERKALNNHAAYVLVLTQKSRYRLAPYGGLFGGSGARGNSTSH